MERNKEANCGNCPCVCLFSDDEIKKNGPEYKIIGSCRKSPPIPLSKELHQWPIVHLTIGWCGEHPDFELKVEQVDEEEEQVEESTLLIACAICRGLTVHAKEEDEHFHCSICGETARP